MVSVVTWPLASGMVVMFVLASWRNVVMVGIFSLGGRSDCEVVVVIVMLMHAPFFDARKRKHEGAAVVDRKQVSTKLTRAEAGLIAGPTQP